MDWKQTVGRTFIGAAILGYAIAVVFGVRDLVYGAPVDGSPVMRTASVVLIAGLAIAGLLIMGVDSYD